ncbi:MAG: transglycosylase SLT domain-containing protein [Thermodesulfovibrionales bacterium]|nr:transglycosylase SLT domain-containing protein [Thermodesulfovibrionales bacterium]
MNIFRNLSLLFLILCTFLPVYASEPDETFPDEQPVISSLPDERLRDSLGLIPDKVHNEIALEAIERNITLFSGKIRERFSLWLSRSGKYLDLMKDILKEQNVPEEIVFLPLIESGFNPYAYSPARAAGYWQFIASTAKRYGLEINWWRDERRDPVKSTVAAANYLSDLYKMFGSWNLAMAAYNAGEGKIMRALNRSKSDNYWALLDTQYIKNETKNYVPKFIAAKMIAQSPQMYGFDDFEYHPPLNYEQVTVNSPLDLDIAADCAETSIAKIKELNPELRRWCTPPGMFEYALRIPEGKKDAFLENLSRIPEEQRFSVDRYTVKKGDTFKKISKKTGVPVQVLLDLNDMEKIMPLKTGTDLLLPPKDKFILDTDDRMSVKKASYKQKKKKSRSKANTVKKISYKNKKKTPAARGKDI